MGADQPLYFTGQPDLWPFGNKKHSSPAFQKKGGKVDRLSDYLKIVQKEQSDYRKNNRKEKIMLNKILNIDFWIILIFF